MTKKGMATTALIMATIFIFGCKGETKGPNRILEMAGCLHQRAYFVIYDGQKARVADVSNTTGTNPMVKLRLDGSGRTFEVPATDPKLSECKQENSNDAK